MKIKIKIKTPKGNAQAIEKKIKFILLPRGLKHQLETTKEDDQIIWKVEDDPRKVMKLIRNVSMWDTIITGIFGSKLLRKVADRSLKDGSVEDLEEMLVNHTSVEVIRGE